MLADARAELASRERGRGLLPPQPSAQTERVWQAPPTQQQQQQQQQPAPFARYLNQQHSASLAQPPSTATPSTTATPRHLQHQHQHQPYLFSNTPASTAHAPNPSSTTQTSPASTTHLPTRTSGTNTSTNTSVNVNVNVNVNGTGSVNVNTATHHHPHFRSKRVCTLTCRHCTNEVCSRGMKAILLGDLRVELFSTDSPPSKVQLVELDYMTRNCRCRIRDVACLGCGNVIGYHVTQPCDRCLESCNNGHFWMFLSEGVTSTDRMDLSGTKHLVWAQLPVVEMDAGGAGARESVGEEVVCR
ncbi:FAM72 protein-domain-containing protein [Fimicolochytrium jonesii]|uniref:FAM72 protein-domain-containing protein n=1 Tax=Fimicolochytrium jonesii TaxID=1396493 RepID=UPI0022FDDA2C|nr:FAM72 protein-domain-containing protein [Fimicolochytrium jonesii]KAI8816592.1 FAM72 protein-domain-containing protein [Fimicolochytrium jonesii]